MQIESNSKMYITEERNGTQMERHIQGALEQAVTTCPAFANDEGIKAAQGIYTPNPETRIKARSYIAFDTGEELNGTEERAIDVIDDVVDKMPGLLHDKGLGTLAIDNAISRYQDLLRAAQCDAASIMRNASKKINGSYDEASQFIRIARGLKEITPIIRTSLQGNRKKRNNK